METNIVREFDKKISDETIVNIPKRKTYDEIIDELEEENENLASNMPWNATEQATEITIDDATKYSKNKLELFGNTYQLSLPSGYTCLEYIECTGTQYINLDYVIKSNTKLEIEYQTEKVRNNTLFGASNNNINYYASGLAESAAQTGQDSPKQIKVSVNLSTEKTSLLWERAQVTYNGNIVTGNFGLDDSSLVLFKNRRWPSDLGKVKLYKFIAYDGNIIAANYIPCKNSNNEIGLYDLVSNTFYGNSGTGDLVAGTDLGTMPSPDYPQPIHVVSGENTISTGSTDYPINLGSLELCKIGDYQDYLYKENGNWYKYEVINKKQLTSNMNWIMYEGDTILFSVYGFSAQNGSKVLCTHYQGITYPNSIYNINNNEICYQNIKRLWIRDTRFSTLEEFKEWLDENVIELLFVLSTATKTQITDITLISQLEAIYEHLKLVKGTNNITVTAEDLAPYMKLSYMQDLPSKLDKLEAMIIENS